MAKKATKAQAPKADPKTAAKAEAKAPARELVVPALKPGAMSVSVGPVVLAAIGSYTQGERQIGELKRSIEQKQYEALAQMTAGIVKAAKADASIRLEGVFEDKQAKARLNNQIYFALGLKHAITVGKEGSEKQKIVWTPEAAELIEPNEKDPKDLATQKGTIRTNLAHMLTKCTKAAVGIIDDDIKVDTDKASGSLMLTGPAVKKHFGEASVVLNEKQTVQVKDKKGAVVGEKQLLAKPSFTEIAKRAAEAHGQVHATRVDSRIGATVDVNKHIIDLAGMLLKAVNALKEVPDTVKTALESVANAIDEKLV